MINIVSDSHYLSSDYLKNNLEVNNNSLSTYLDIKYIKNPIIIMIIQNHNIRGSLIIKKFLIISKLSHLLILL